ncbi:CynX/NimT family MFS transporter [Histidinibacterium lentulum]|uniref:MFS transporter n=1 Tax=Histidinibacterium lentulum TaxID=2480588 RepID=A0A3N2QYX9_9RHOB|nr:MFS transporter [Histidinibacterium lentulum]ROU00328.1 MFS transporter [Histidinibacterium lentulum]
MTGTNWRMVGIAFGAGVVAAMHIGKLPPAIGAIREDLGAGLVMAGWIASTISAVGTLTGLVAGGLADRAGPRRTLVGGLLALAFGSLAGSLATAPALMLLARFVEGIGFTATTVAGGILIARATSEADRRRAMARWATFMPLGFTAMLLVSALMTGPFGWRPVWLIAAGITLLWAGIVLRATGAGDGGEGRRDGGRSLGASLALDLGRTGAVLAAVCYGLYAAQHLGMMTWLPTILADTRATGPLAAALVTAMVLMANAGGNLLAARALGRGAPIWRLLALGSLGMLCVELLVFSAGLPDALRLALLVLFGLAGGLIPAAALAAAPVYAPSPALVGVLTGLMVMATNLGQLAGPPLMASARVAAGDWSGTVLLLGGLAVAALVSALASARHERAARAPAPLPG